MTIYSTRARKIGKAILLRLGTAPLAEIIEEVDPKATATLADEAFLYAFASIRSQRELYRRMIARCDREMEMLTESLRADAQIPPPDTQNQLVYTCSRRGGRNGR